MEDWTIRLYNKLSNYVKMTNNLICQHTDEICLSNDLKKKKSFLIHIISTRDVSQILPSLVIS